MFIIYVFNLFDVQQKHLTKDYIYGIYIYLLTRVKNYRKNIFENFKKVLALYYRCAIIKMSKGGKAF